MERQRGEGVIVSVAQGKRVWNGALEDYPLESYPDYAPGKPPQHLGKFHDASFLDEVELIWGRKWGSQGIGRLRDVVLVQATEHESNPLWARAPEYFYLRKGLPDWKRIAENLSVYAETLQSLGVTVHWMEYRDVMGAYGPLRKLFIAAALRVVRGGALLMRGGHGAYKRGKEREWQRFCAEKGIPILLTVTGRGIAEVGTLMAVAEDVMLWQYSSGVNQEGLDQVMPVLQRAGVRELHMAHGTTILNTFESGGEFHIDMSLGVVDHKLAVIFPAQVDWGTYSWLAEKGFKFIEIPPDEQRLCNPSNLVLIEPGLVIMAREAKETVRRVRKAGVEVVELDTTGLIQGGTNGIYCVTGYLARDPGPSLDDAPRRHYTVD